jgi:pyridoxine 5-phosphate synthase
MTKLSVNINKIALLRNSRGRNFPDPAEFSRKCLELGAHGITLHPRPDQRHARYSDIFELRKVCDQFGAELNVEGYPTDLLIDKVIEAKADQFTLVPDEPGQITSDHGWDFVKHEEELKRVIEKVSSNGIRLSLFADYDNPDIKLAKELGAHRLELYTEPYAEHFGQKDCEQITHVYAKTAKTAMECGLELNAGHDLSLENLGYYIKHVPGTLEVSIGHALIVECLDMGLEKVIKGYLAILNES